MNEFVRAALSNEAVSEAAKLYNIKFSDLTLLRDNVNIIYRFSEGDKKFILRLTHSSHQCFDTVNSEIYWINFLHDNKIPVSNPLPSVNNNLCEKVTTGDSYFSVVKFTAAPGVELGEKNWNSNTIAQMGRITGMIHKCSKTYSPPDTIKKRTIWPEKSNKMVETYLPKSEMKSWEYWTQLLNIVKQLPSTSDSFGVVHNDIHRGNFMECNGRLTLFDCEDACYTWFVNDISCPLFFAVNYNGVNDFNRRGWARYFMDSFMRGYQKYNRFDLNQLNLMPELLHLRGIFVYAYLFKAWDVTKLNHVQLNYFNRMKHIAENGFDWLKPEDYLL